MMQNVFLSQRDSSPEPRAQLRMNNLKRLVEGVRWGDGGGGGKG